MRTLISTVVVGICLAASPVLAQQHPWVGSDVYTGTVQNDVSVARTYGRVHKGDVVVPATRPAPKATNDDLYGACESSHAVFSCPGSL